MASLVRQHSKRGAEGNASPSSGDALPISMPSAGSNSINDRRRLSDADTKQNGERHDPKGDSIELAGEDHETYNEGAEPTDEDEGYFAVDSDGLPNYAWFLTGNSAKNAPRPTSLDHLHPFVQLLSFADLEDCVKVEEAFPPHERCSKEKLRYRLTRCPELSLGLFSLPPKSEWKDGQRPERATLVAHIIATRTNSLMVTDKSMDIPEDWESKSSMSLSSEPAVGHEEGGLTIAIHSLAVLQEHQGKKLGSTLMKAYLQRIKEAATAERVALIAHDHLIPFYESFGFCNKGRSACQFGGGGWFDMVLEFSEDTDSEDSFPL
ncbi:Heat shock protein ssb1 [Ascosphaera pollenicola]|nr:Heat shock protein ssb1 [Ascosphaera pollenicola]